MAGGDAIVAFLLVFGFLLVVSKSFRQALGFGLGLAFVGIVLLIIFLLIIASV